MEIEFDPKKSAKNEKERALPFQLVRELEWSEARITRDRRRDYGEERFLAFVPKSVIPKSGYRFSDKITLKTKT